MARKVIFEAEDKKDGMTLGEMAAFVQDAMRADHGPDTKFKVINGLRSQIQRLETRS